MIPCGGKLGSEFDDIGSLPANERVRHLDSETVSGGGGAVEGDSAESDTRCDCVRCRMVLLKQKHPAGFDPSFG